LHIAAARGVEKSFGELEATLFLHLEARSRLANMGARPGGTETPRVRAPRCGRPSSSG
jgi:hypothetical protein